MTVLTKPGVLERPTCTVAGASPEDLANQLDAALTPLNPVSVRIVRLGNPLRQRLTLKRLLLQINILDERSESDEAAIANVLGRSWGEESYVVLVIEQADSLAPDAARFLAALARSFQGRAPSLHVVFAGSLALLDRDLDAVLPRPFCTEREPLAPPSSIAIPPPPAAAWPAAALPLLLAPGRWGRSGLVAAVLTLCLLAGAAVTVRSSLRNRSVAAAAGQGGGATVPMVDATMIPRVDIMPVPAVEPPASLAPIAPPAILPSVADVTPKSSPVSEPTASTVPLKPALANPALSGSAFNDPGLSREDTDWLRKDFDRFLTHSSRPRTALTKAQREVLFSAYLQWRTRQAGDLSR